MPFEDAQAVFFFGGKEEFVGSNNFFLLVSLRRISWWHYFKITRRLRVTMHHVYSIRLPY